MCRDLRPRKTLRERQRTVGEVLTHDIHKHKNDQNCQQSRMQPALYAPWSSRVVGSSYAAISLSLCTLFLHAADDPLDQPDDEHYGFDGCKDEHRNDLSTILEDTNVLVGIRTEQIKCY